MATFRKHFYRMLFVDVVPLAISEAKKCVVRIKYQISQTITHLRFREYKINIFIRKHESPFMSLVDNLNINLRV